MKQELQSLIRDIRQVHEGEPWFGRSIFSLLQDVDPAKAGHRSGPDSHSMLDILWHMNTWLEFTLQRLEKKEQPDLKAAEELDWRILDPGEHNWQKGMAAFRNIYDRIIQLLQKIPDDRFLEEKVDYRDYNYRYLLRGITEHNIYHAGQIAWMSKYT